MKDKFSFTKIDRFASGEKEELYRDIEEWIDSAISRLNELKYAAVQIIEGDSRDISVDNRTWSLLNMIINLRESRLKRKREVKELMANIRRESLLRKDDSQERRDEAKRLMDGFKRERERTSAEWQKTLDIMGEKRRELKG